MNTFKSCVPCVCTGSGRKRVCEEHNKIILGIAECGPDRYKGHVSAPICEWNGGADMCVPCPGNKLKTTDGNPESCVMLIVVELVKWRIVIIPHVVSSTQIVQVFYSFWKQYVSLLASIPTIVSQLLTSDSKKFL